MCDVSESTIQELLLASLAAPEHKDAGATQADLLRAAQGQQACIIHSVASLRTLLRNGHATADSTNGAQDPTVDPNARWKIASAPAPAQGTEREAKRKLGNCIYSPSDVIGRGRMGIVVLGENEFLHRPVAIKFLSVTGDKDFEQKFEREARVLARLDHPHIVKLYDGGRDGDGRFYIAMEHIKGGTLFQHTKQMGRLPAPLVAQYMFQVASALAEAHRHGILHRDIKPENVMMGENGPKVGDFSLAGIEPEALQQAPSTFEPVASEPGQAPQLVGTLPYIAPERAARRRGDVRSDIYSLGATFYSVAAGGYLFEGVPSDNYVEWLWHHTKDNPKRLTERVPGFHPGLADIIHRCLAKDPDQRYPDYQELLRDLKAVRRGLAPELAQVSTFDPVASAPADAPISGTRGRRLGLVAVACVLAILVAFFAINPFKGVAEPPAAPAAHKPASMAEAPPAPKGEVALNPPEKEATPNATAPKPEPAPPPRLRDKLLTCPTTESTQAAMARLLDAVGDQYSQLRTLSYDGADAALQLLRAELPAGEREQQEYLRTHFDSVANLVALAKGTAEAGWGAIHSASGNIKVRLADGKAFEGRVESVAERAFVLADERGQRLSVQPSTINPREILRDGGPAVPQLAYRTLSISATDELGALLKSEEESLLWIPVATRLARLEAHEKAKRAAAKAKGLLVEKKPGEDILTEVPEYMDVLAGVRSMCGLQEGVLSVYPYLGPEFFAAKSEEQALGLLLGREYSRIITTHRGTASYGPAAELILGAFQRKIAAAHTELMAKTGWIGWDWRLHPPVKPPQDPLDYWRPDVQAGTSILRDPEGTHMLVMHRDHSRTPEGVRLTVQFAADEGARADEACWKFHLRGDKGSDTYLRFQRKKIALCRMLLKPGEDEEIVSVCSAETGGDHVYTLVPSGQELHIYRDGNLLLTVPQSQAAVPQRLAFSVLKGTLTIKFVQVLKI